MSIEEAKRLKTRKKITKRKKLEETLEKEYVLVRKCKKWEPLYIVWRYWFTVMVESYKPQKDYIWLRFYEYFYSSDKILWEINIET